MASPSTILFIRHAEKPTLGVRGVNEDGANDDQSLTPRGWQRAGALAVSFRNDPRLPKPSAIFAPLPTPAEPSKRALQTVIPLGDVLGLEVRATHPKSDFSATLAEAMRTPGVVLVAWEHKLLGTTLTSGLGPQFEVEGRVPDAWPDDRFDVVWAFEHVADRRYRFSQVPELVLSGDSAKGIG